MQTHTSSAPAPQTRHRLYVALPLFALCSLLSLGVGMMQRASLVGHSAAVAMHGSGTLLTVVFNGDADISASDETLHMSAGTTMFAARGIMHIDAAGFSLTGWNGVCEITSDDHTVTVAAFSTPVIVRSANDLWVVPAGMQLYIDAETSFADDADTWTKAHVPMPLPDYYLLEKLPAADDLYEQTGTHPVAMTDSIVPPLLGQKLRLQAARQVAVAQQRMERVGVLATALADGDTHAAQALLGDSEIVDMLHTPEARPFLPDMLANAVALNLEPGVLPAFLDNGDHRLIALFHPALRSYSWTLDDIGLTADEELLTLALLPFSDNDTQPIPAIVSARWSSHWVAFLKGNDRAQAVAAVLLPRYVQQVNVFDVQGYPERARRTAGALRDAFGSVTLSDGAAAALRELTALAQDAMPVTVPVIVSSSSVSSASSSSVAALSPQEAHERTEQVRQMLGQYQFMFTPATSVSTLADGMVQVSDIALGTNAGDQLLTFSYDVIADKVLHIEQNGEELPYALSLEQYVQWIKTR